jgi:hypothetical protein
MFFTLTFAIKRLDRGVAFDESLREQAMKPVRKILACGAVTVSIFLGSTQAMAEEDGWHFTFSPLYLWAKNVDAITTAGGRDAPLSLDFKDDILENLDAALAMRGEASNGTWTLFLEYNYAKLDPSVKTSVGPVQIRANVDFEDVLVEGGATWAFADNGSSRWELLGGLRYIKQDVEIETTNTLPIEGPIRRTIKVGDSWMHPMVGLRYTGSFSERWSFRARADYGYEGSDNTALNGGAYLDYRFRDWGSVFFGYRYIDIDFDNRSSRFDQYGFNGDEQGPVLGLNLHF